MAILTTPPHETSTVNQAMLRWRGDLNSDPQVFVIADTAEQAEQIRELLADKLRVAR